jgi:hypothetical protein
LPPRTAAVVLAALVALAAWAGPASSAQAATYTVGTTSDTPSGGKCAEPASAKCSLRQLIEYENGLATTPSPPDVVVVPAGAYELKEGVLEITQSLVIIGAGARTTTVDVSPNAVAPQKVFDIQAPALGGEAPTIGIFGLKIAGGTSNESNFGGDIRSTGSVVLVEDWITGGTAPAGGGISNDGGTLVLDRSLVSGNHASLGVGDGGGIMNYGSGTGCPSACAPGTRAILALEDSTVTGNDARLGAGIISRTEEGVADENGVSIIDSTIAYNTTKEETGGPAGGPGAGLLVSEGTADVVGSILVFNNEINEIGNFTATNCATSGSATIASLGYNLEGGTDCGFKSTGDLKETFPEFSSSEPQTNSGSTDTLALEPTSPAVDAIPVGNPFCSGADQRGVARPQGTGCDIGAVELVPFTIEPTEGSQFSGQLAKSGCSVIGTPTIEWGDGQNSAATVTSSSSISGSHTYVEEGTYNGSVSYEDDCGKHRVAFQAKVADAPLSATGAAVSGTAGTPIAGTVATFTDADPVGAIPDYTTAINWGDGNASPGTVVPAPGGGFAVTGSHTYAAGGTYSTGVAITDVGGAAATATSSAAVANTAPAPPTVVTASSPTVLTTTSAAFTTTVNPHGLPTTAHFEYGPVLGGGNPATIVYGSTTPEQAVGSDFANHTVAATVTGLLPNVLYHVRAVATNSAGSALGADQILNTPADPPPPPPVLGKSVNVVPVSGIVYIELPPGAKLASVSPFSPLMSAVPALAAPTKGQSFIPLTEARQIPVGSILESTHGVVGITTATTASRKGKLQSGDFGGGLFKLLQNRRQHGLTELNIIDNFSANKVCSTLGKARIAAKHLSSKVLGRLNASGHGHFTARGQYSAATVRGTIWSVTNQCDGTLTHVKRGVIAVRDFRRRRTFTLYTGQSYLARAPHA